MNRLAVTAISAFLFVVLNGCGFVEDIQDLRPPTFHLEGNCTVVLDWTGGYNPLWFGDSDLPPIDLTEFDVWPSGRTLADVDGFTEMVRVEVEVILSESGLHVAVEEGEQRHNATVVHFSQVTDPENGASLGRGHFDICNISDQDYSIVYAARLLGEVSRLDEGEWVRLFANIAAHEIAHNIGYDHVEPIDVPESEFVELMIGSQTILQRVMEQRIIVEQDTCVVFGEAKATASDLDRNGRPTRTTKR